MDTYSQHNQDQQTISIKDILDLVWRLRVWIIICAAVALLAGFVYIRIQTPTYQRSITMMLNSDSGQSDLSVLYDMTGVRQDKKIDNEIFILQSASMMQNVVEELGLNSRYYHYALPILDRLQVAGGVFAIKKVEYYEDSPFSFSFEADPLYPEASLPSSLQLSFRNYNSKSYSIESLMVNGRRQQAESRKYAYGETVNLAGFSFSINLDSSGKMLDEHKYLCSWTSPHTAAKSFSGKLTVEIQSPIRQRQSNVVKVSIVDTKPGRADDILNTLLLKVNDEAHRYSNLTSINTINFIDERLNEISKELSSAESDYRVFQTTNTVVDLGAQSNLTIQEGRVYQEQLDEVNVQLQLLAMVSDVLKDTKSGKFSVIPSNIGVTDAGLNSIISNYNSMVSERNRMVSNSSENNPRVLSLNSQLADIRQSIEISIENLENIYSIRKKELLRNVSTSKSKMSVIPRQQFEMQQLNRRLEVIEPLYQLLQQKREEAHIAMYSEVDDFRLIEPSTGAAAPISPKKIRIYLLCLIIGCSLPMIYSWLRMQLRTKVETKQDITDHINANVLGVIPKYNSSEGELIKRDSRNPVCESFRNLRSNLQYLNDVKVIQVTSSIAGEGKSFVAANLALSIAHVGHKVLLVGLDIRKPRLIKMFPANNIDKNNTMVGFLIGKCDGLDALVNHTEESSHLDIVYAGPVPPNPAELISQGKLAEFIEYFKERYDYIIIDSAPYLPVSDSFLINSYVDATIYTVRANHTPLHILDEANSTIHSEVKPVKRVNIVLNDIDYSESKYRYGYGKGYGYGYGYGYRRGYGYGYGHVYGYGYGYDYGYGEDVEGGKKVKAGKKNKEKIDE
ncbi:MAG: polysaccharide biosynthesis tyrosine autokinase [Bacteroidales bacterium]|nr:polysaccharide biosynthesis tyrosine autokinase [Bacteroidales bacterium]